MHHAHSAENSQGAHPNAWARKGFLPPPCHGLGPWSIYMNLSRALLPVGPGLSHSLPGDSCCLAPVCGGRALYSLRTGRKGPTRFSPAPRWARAEVGHAGPTTLGSCRFQPCPCPW